MTAELADTVAARYRGRITRGFVAGKLRADPVLPALLALPPLGAVLDLGCGRGQLGIALLLAGRADRLTGFDLDDAKIARARESAADLPADFAVADLGAAALPPCDTALLIDVLSQVPQAMQRSLLARAAAAASARIVIRSLDLERGWRSAVGLAAEHLRRGLGADRGGGGGVAPLPVADLAQPLEAAGFRITITPCWAGTPLPNVLMVAERP